MTCEARQTPKGHTSVYCGGKLLATISGAGRTRGERMRCAKIIAATMNSLPEMPGDDDIKALERYSDRMIEIGIPEGHVVKRVLGIVKTIKKEESL